MGKYFDIGISGIFGGFVGSILGFFTSGKINMNLAFWMIIIAFAIVVVIGVIVDFVIKEISRKS
jgi:phosphotransferase system  glucose/maltose/N-acetylglucosamine-specific IIC component